MAATPSSHVGLSRVGLRPKRGQGWLERAPGLVRGRRVLSVYGVHLCVFGTDAYVCVSLFFFLWGWGRAIATWGGLVWRCRGLSDLGQCSEEKALLVVCGVTRLNVAVLAFEYSLRPLGP